MDFYGSDTVIILRKIYGGYDEYGQPESLETSIEVSGVFVAWGSSSIKEEINRLSSEAQITFYMPYGTAVRNGDNFLFDNERWERAGTVEKWKAPSSFANWETGVVIEAKRVEG